MVPEIRDAFNASFTQEKYQHYLNQLDAKHPGAIEFRIAETPIFCDKSFTKKMIDACESIVDVVISPSFKQLTERSIPQGLFVPGENDYSHFIAFDFGICENEKGEIEPQLIEMQGFPTLFAFQPFQIEALYKSFSIPGNYDPYLNNFNKETYLQLLKEIIYGEHSAEDVILLEIFPEKQKTRIDFYCTEDYIGIKAVSITDVVRKGNKLFYLKDGEEKQIKRIYNRVIFDDLQQQTPEVQQTGKILFEELDVEWVSHPNWFYRISKYTLPFIHHPYVPETKFLNEINILPDNLNDFVLKPLFSFAGQGVVIDVTKEDIEKVKDPENWILQRKVKYADIIKTPDEPAKAEIRVFYFWKHGEPRPVATLNLSRLSKGKMIGVRYNKDKNWVGGTVAFFEK
jgi:hypothetical protein